MLDFGKIFLDIYVILIAIFTIAIPAGLLFFVGRHFGIKKGLQLSLQDPTSIFEQQHLKEGIEIFDSFLELQFLKYVHNLLVSYANKSKFPIKAFLNSSLSEEDMDKKLVGFLTTISLKLSRDLKNLFYRYYSRYDDKGEELNTLEHYITEWFIIRVRKINAEYISAIGDDMSEMNLVSINSRIFVIIEMTLYEKMGIVNAPQTQIKQPINKDLLK